MISSGLLIAVMLAWTPAQVQSPPAPAEPAAEAAAPGSAADAGALALQVALDRAGFSPGAIDGRFGPNTQKALDAYVRQHGAPPAAQSPTIAYTITDADAAGPFVESIPADLMEQATLPALSYTSVVEALSERFHSTPALLKRLNPGTRWQAGETIHVPDVEPLVAPVGRQDVTARSAEDGAPRAAGTSGRTPAAGDPAAPGVAVTVSKGESALTVTDAAGRIVLYAPVTTGSEHDPLPLGEWKVTGLHFNPPFHYNPDLFWDADPAHAKARIPAGPNNPVGLVWIDISKEHYGIHGTPDPSAIGRSESHGCVRLTNWDVLRLAALVEPGTKVVFTR